MRHGERAFGWRDTERLQRLRYLADPWTSDSPDEPAEERKKSDFDRTGLACVRAMAGRLADELELSGVGAVSIEWSGHKVAQDTATVLTGVLRHRRITIERAEADDGLTPPEVRSDKVVEERVVSLKSHTRKALESSETLIVVAHQPDLTHLAEAFVGPLRTGGLPLAHAEVACIELDDGPDKAGTLAWTLTRGNKDVRDQLREKLKSKFALAGMILSALLVESGLILNKDLWELKAAVPLAFVCVGYLLEFLALGLIVATLLAYDELTMPTKFWSEGRERPKWRKKLYDLVSRPPGSTPPWSVRRPPSSDETVLYCEMVNVWNRLFLPALLAAFASIACFLTAFATNSLALMLNLPWYVAALVAALAMALIAGALGYAIRTFFRFRPGIGVND
jgi:phosphohistidine phosphatase SixA